jgi:ubiquinone/menaquinone biosynthesis C-methylase UbiE
VVTLAAPDFCVGQQLQELNMQSSKNLYWANNASKYDKNTNKDVNSLLSRIQGDIGYTNRVLDVAAGTGNVSLFLAKYVQHIDTLDHCCPK